eukprot:scaffold34039_cov60-Phaeocystis_antarctica.AAC.2
MGSKPLNNFEAQAGSGLPELSPRFERKPTRLQVLYTMHVVTHSRVSCLVSNRELDASSRERDHEVSVSDETV